jgi:hypothetical protein
VGRRTATRSYVSGWAGLLAGGLAGWAGLAAGWLQRASEVHFSELATATVAIYLARWLATGS